MPSPYPLTPVRVVPALIAAAFTLAAFAYSLWSWNLEFVYYSFWMVVFIVGVWWLDRRVGVPTVLVWLLTGWTVAHLVGGTLPIPESITEPGRPHTLYNMRVEPWFPKYDQVVHCLGFMVATLTAWAGLRSTYFSNGGSGGGGVGPPRIGFGLGLAIVMMGMGLGAMNEVIEFVATLIFPDTNVGGYDNTGWDLVSNFAGCVIAVVIIRGRERRRPGPVSPAPVRP
jgi:hypothetical protein